MRPEDTTWRPLSGGKCWTPDPNLAKEFDALRPPPNPPMTWSLVSELIKGHYES